LEYLINLTNLEYSLILFNYYRKFILNFAGIIEPLEVLKIAGFRLVLKKTTKKKRHSIVEKEPFTIGKEYKKAWDMLKGRLYLVEILGLLDFTKPFILYINSSKKKGYRVALY
jgi:hypothetical protein